MIESASATRRLVTSFLDAPDVAAQHGGAP